MFIQRLPLTILLLFFTIANGMAQALKAENDIIDCGQILFQTPKTVSVTLHNTSSKQVSIQKIRPGCGCTTAKVSKKNIGSRKSTTLEITYDAKMLGHFSRYIEVFTKNVEEPLLIQIRGVVVTEIKDFSQKYPYQIGTILTDKEVIEFDDVNRGTTPSQTINILNTTGSAIEPVIMHLPNYLTAEVSPQRLLPEERGEIRFTLHSGKIRDMGLQQTSVYLAKNIGEKISPDKEIPVSIVLLPSFDDKVSTLSAPHITLSDTILSVRNMKGRNEKLKGEITIQNTGKETLDITSLQMFTAGLEVSLSKQSLKPMESTTLKVTIDTEQLKGQKTRPRILMITNDPQTPKVIIKVSE